MLLLCMDGHVTLKSQIDLACPECNVSRMGLMSNVVGELGIFSGM